MPPGSAKGWAGKAGHRIDPLRLAPALLHWWEQHGRHDLPWQQDVSPYRVWVSEIMLQQTQVATVERYYLRFMQRFPDVQTLATAPEDDVLHQWSGLGYYSRARNMHAAAQHVVAEYDGKFPADPESLMALPGIGRSTAAAILALAYGQQQTILDGNVKRVLSRYAGIDGWPGSTANLKQLWELAVACTPQSQPASYTQAIMDFGATLCTRSRPRCPDCPLQADCVAHVLDRVAEIPASRPRRRKPQRSAVLLMLRRGAGEVLLTRRPPQGIWGGLWSFPEFDGPAAAADWCQQRFGAAPQKLHTWPVVDHSFSHFDLAMTPLEGKLPALCDPVMEGGQWLWYNTRSPEAIGLAAPVARLLEQLSVSKA